MTRVTMMMRGWVLGIVVGVLILAGCANPAGGESGGGGSAEESPWQLVYTFEASGVWEVDMSGDGSVVVLGCPTRNVGTNESQGVAVVYRKVGGVWEEEVLQISGGAPYDYLGADVAVSGDGSLIVVSRPGGDVGGNENQGDVYVYEWDGTDWVGTQLVASDGGADDWYGEPCVAVTSDGTRIAVGAAYRGSDNTGAVYVYRKEGGTWVEEAILEVDDGDPAYDYFPSDVALSSDGITLVCGVAYSDEVYPNGGLVYVFTRTGTTWLESYTIGDDQVIWWEDWFGRRVSLSDDGTVLAIGAPQKDIPPENERGGGYVYTYNGNLSIWERAEAFTPSEGTEHDEFGWTLALSGDGKTVAFSAPWANPDGLIDAGKVYVYHGEGTEWTSWGEITAPDIEADTEFGEGGMVLSSDGRLLVVACPNRGEAYLFEYAP